MKYTIYTIKVKKTAEAVIEVEARTSREATARALKEASHGSVLWERHHFKPVILQARREGGRR